MEEKNISLIKNKSKIKHPLFYTLFLLLFSVLNTTAFAQQKLHTPNILLAYVTAGPSTLPDPALLTNINYAFAHVNSTHNGIIISKPERLKQIVALKSQKPSLKVSLSVGGWTSGGFSEMASNDITRMQFAEDCAQKVKEFQLDGIDIDWEYPTDSSAHIKATADDTKNFTKLMQDLRKCLGPNALLTLASIGSAKYIDFKSILPYISFVNIMAYDLDVIPHHHSSLYRSKLSGKLTIQEAINDHLNAGVPADKLVLGFPFYGHGKGGDGPLPYYVNYKDIVHIKAFHQKWDKIAKAPYLVDKEGNMVLTFENPKSIKDKCKLIKEKGLKGAMFWDYDGDTPEGTLRKALYKSLF